MQKAYEAGEDLDLLAQGFGLTSRRIRQVAKEQGWKPRPPITVPSVTKIVDAKPRSAAIRIAAALAAQRVVKGAPEPLPSGPKPPRWGPAALPAPQGEPRAKKPPMPDELKSTGMGIMSAPAFDPPEEAAAELSADSGSVAEVLRQQIMRSHILGGMFRKLVGLLDSALTQPHPLDEVAIQKKIEALNTLMPGRTDSLATAITVTRQVAEVLRTYENGIIEINRDVQRERDAKGLIEGADGEEAASFADMSTEQLEQLYAAAAILDDSQQRRPVEMPPTGPVTIEHAE